MSIISQTDQTAYITCALLAENKKLKEENEKLKTENKKISQQRDRLLKKNKRQAKENEELKELMKDYESVIPDDYDTATPDDIKKVIEELKEKNEDQFQKGYDKGALENSVDTEFLEEKEAEIADEKRKVFYYDGFLTKMFDEDENGEWSEWTDFVEKQSFEDGKKLFGFEGDSDDEE